MRNLLATMVVGLFVALPSSDSIADPHPKGFSNHRFNAVRPVTKGGVTTFRIQDKQCSKVDYGDGRGESDCYNGNVRSILIYHPDARLNSALEYHFDIWIDPSLSYGGFYNDHSIGFLEDALDSRLRIASWEGPYLHNFLYMLKVDTIHGITFLGNQCQPKERFGQWVSFSMKVRWTTDKHGWIKVSCDDKVIYSAEAVATNQAPHCYINNQCEPGVKKNPKRIIFVVGPVMAGFGYEWKKYGKQSQFTDIQPEGITIKMRNMAVTKIAEP